MDLCLWVSGLLALNSRSGLAFPAFGECSLPVGAITALVLSELCAAPACWGSAPLCVISLSDFSVSPRSLSFFLFLLFFPGLIHILRLARQDVPPQPSVSSWSLAKLPHCGQLAPSGHFTVLQTERTRESLRLSGF